MASVAADTTSKVTRTEKGKSPAVGGQDIPLLGAYLRALETAPVRTKVLTSIVVMGAAQSAAQRVSKGAIVDRRGVGIWAVWGCVLGFLNNLWQSYIARHGPANLLGKIAVDHMAWKVPMLYAFVAYERMMRGCSPREALRQCIATATPLQFVCVRVFPVAQILNFTLVPLPLRVLYMNVTLFFWCLYVATKV